MSESAMESIRQRLEATRRRQNLSLALTHSAYWLFSISLLFALGAALGWLLGLGTTGWRAVFVVWTAGTFLLSSWFIWRFSLRWQDSRRFVHQVERQLPDLEQRLITSVEFENRDSPGVSRQFIERLLADAQARVEARPFQGTVSFRPAKRAMGIACVAVATMTLALLLSESFLQASRQLAWPWRSGPGAGEAAALPVALYVDPGDVSMQRGDDLRVVASLENASSDQLLLYVQDDRLNWKQVTMAPEDANSESGEVAAGNAKVFETELQQLSQDLVYYVEYRSGDDVVRSPQFRVTLFDLPRVDGLELAYDFPAYTGLENKVENPGGDVVAPEGTTINVSATLNKAVKEARLVFDDGESVPLTLEDKRARGSFQVDKDSNYRIELVDVQDYRNKNPAEYYIRAIQDQPPEISLRTPGRDQRVMPLEEVAFEISAEDDYGLTQFELSYSVVGVGDKKIDFLGQAQAGTRKTISGDTLIYLEDLEVKPGDIISYSVAAKDNNDLRGPNQVVSDIYFLEVIPTDHEFSRARSGGGGGGGGGGGDSSALVKTQKDVIAATWKLRNRQHQVDEQSFAEDGQIIRDSQAEVAQRAQMSINRLTERGSFADENYENAVVALRRAIEEMEAALESLDQLALAEALESEQRALQSILQAESQVNRTEVAMNRNGGGGSGGPGQEREDLRELFEMEMGELENRYELPQQQAGQPNQAQNETLDKLKELARRQERLTRSQRDLARRENQMDEEQRRRQLEQLRREQEELRRQLADLSRSMQQQSGQPQSGQQQSGQQSQSQSQAASGGQSGPQDQQAQAQQRQQQLDRLQQALQQMQEAAQSESPSQAAAKGQKALENLREQAQQMDANSQRSLADLQESAKKRSEELLQQQRQLRRMVEERSRNESLSNTRAQTARSGAADDLLQQQAQVREGLSGLARDLRDIAILAGEDDQRELQEAHEISRDLRPIQEKMDTSKQILERGMLNLSLKLENDIENQLSDLRRRIQGMGDGPGAPGGEEQTEQVANQVRQLREALQELQQQVNEQSGSFQQPDQLARRQGERSGAGQQERAGGDTQEATAGRGDMERSLERSRDLARGLAQMGLGGQPWAGSARSIRTQLTQQGLEEFLSRPELLQALLEPIIELEDQMRVQAELNQIDNKLYSALEEDIPEQYKRLVEEYYRVLSESKNANERTR